jgi:ABC-type glycerol-3-phosphate transport system substrate-binding protein
VAFAGCPAASVPSPSGGGKASSPNASGKAPRAPLVLLVVDDPPLGKAIAREWQGRTEEELTVRDVSLADLTKASRLPGDAVIFPSGTIGELAERGLIMPLETAALDDEAFRLRDIFDAIRLREMKWGSKFFAAPLGSPQLLLAYRIDLFDKLGMTPPADWKEYQTAIGRLADRSQLGDAAPPADQPWRGTIEPLADGWAGQLFLARAAAYALHRDQVSPLFRFDSMEPLLDQPPYRRALDELRKAAQTGGFAEQRFAPAEALAELLAGRAGMALTWPAPETTPADTRPTQERIGFALLPGSREAFRFATKSWEKREDEDDRPHVPLLAIAGRMAAVTSSTAEAARSQNFVLWLAGREVSQQVAPHSAATTLFRGSQLAAAGRWTGGLSPDASRQYADTLAQTLRLPRAFPGVRLPGRASYLAALDRAVADAIGGKRSSEALGEAAARWREITTELGVKTQQQANAQSLGQADR